MMKLHSPAYVIDAPCLFCDICLGGRHLLVRCCEGGCCRCSAFQLLSLCPGPCGAESRFLQLLGRPGIQCFLSEARCLSRTAKKKGIVKPSRAL